MSKKQKDRHHRVGRWHVEPRLVRTSEARYPAPAFLPSPIRWRDFDYAEEFKSLDLKGAEERPRCADDQVPGMVARRTSSLRTSVHACRWHSAGTYRTGDGAARQHWQPAIAAVADKNVLHTRATRRRRCGKGAGRCAMPCGMTEGP